MIEREKIKTSALWKTKAQGCGTLLDITFEPLPHRPARPDFPVGERGWPVVESA